MPLTKATQNVIEGIVSTGSTGVSAGSFIVGQQYKITSLGTTTQSQWNTIAGTTGQTYVVGSLFTAATIGAGSGNGAAAVARTLQNRFADVVNVKDFGAVGDGVTDDTAAIQAAVTFAENKILIFPKDGVFTYSATINLPSNIIIDGGGKLLHIGTGSSNAFYALNKTNIVIRNIWFYGNNQATVSGDGLAIWFNQTNSATSSSNCFKVENCRFDNFKGDYWIYVTNDNPTYSMSGIWINNNEFYSYSGNARNGSATTVPSACISISGDLNGATITDVFIDRNKANCKYIKEFLILWQGCNRVCASNNIIKDCGTDSSIGDDAAAYCFLLYSAGSITNRARNITINGNIINAVRSAGIYAAAAEDIIVTNNSIINQTDTLFGTIPKGGIIFNSCKNIIVSNNTLDSIAAFGIYWQPIDTSGPSNILISNNKITNSNYGILLVSFLFNSSGVSIENNIISENIFSIQIQTIGSSVELSDVLINNNNIISTNPSSYGIQLRSDDGFYKIKETFISGNYINVKNYGIVWRGSGPTTINNNTLVGPYTSRGINAVYCNYLSIIGNNFFNFTTGSQCFDLTGSDGVLRDNSFNNCSSSLLIVNSGGSNDMGRVIPTWVPIGRGGFVQNISAIEVGTVGSKYINLGWYFDGTAWRESRSLTGN
jgi:polygalacturonase